MLRVTYEILEPSAKPPQWSTTGYVIYSTKDTTIGGFVPSHIPTGVRLIVRVPSGSSVTWIVRVNCDYIGRLSYDPGTGIVGVASIGPQKYEIKVGAAFMVFPIVAVLPRPRTEVSILLDHLFDAAAVVSSSAPASSAPASSAPASSAPSADPIAASVRFGNATAAVDAPPTETCKRCAELEHEVETLREQLAQRPTEPVAKRARRSTGTH